MERVRKAEQVYVKLPLREALRRVSVMWREYPNQPLTEIFRQHLEQMRAEGTKRSSSTQGD